MDASTLFRPHSRAFTRLLFGAWVLACSLFQYGCGQQAQKPEVLQKAPNVLHTIQLGDATAQVEVVSEPEPMRRGLMHRANLPPNQGMLFVYPSPQRLSFWMQNTQIPLDIGYFTGDGILREIYPMYPYDTDPIQSKRSDIQYALEMNQGWFAKNKVYPGAAIDPQDLKQALGSP
ncbi:MAG: hypothetical protein B7X06_02955 [Verrucomicrobia bacterium 21-51-4]|nr:MAG: hypothetical protein B7X06_02955 [Verrucomicrobia bacterium 21-51-4]HQU08823.1 DUF192 domain-containing protein [Opitutales bacterium]